ncbi:DNA mismatch repair protein MutT [Streptomyces sp. AcH 505]|uniref:GNAT family N-acetyltransferase n=1 Tax=Streptomyces sp. AcH 505 TaxID=352211 RepID=UPI000591E6DC|nr:DNA mismatch repair protein MutT [Streptomyces sp. AcH 505]
MIVEPLTPVDGALPGELLTDLAALYASNREFQQLSGDFPDADHISPEQVATSLADELAHPAAEVLIARAAGRLVAIAVTLAPDPAGTDPSPGPGPGPGPWIGLLMVHADEQRAGYGRELATVVEDRFRASGHTTVRVAVPKTNHQALAFWTALGYAQLAEQEDQKSGRPCRILGKRLTKDGDANGNGDGDA